MSNFLFVPESYFIDSTPTASSEDALYPDDRVTGYAHPAEEYHSADTAETTIEFDTGEADQPIAGIYVGSGVNFTSFYVSASAATDWGDPDFAEISQSVSLDKSVRRYKGLYLFTNWAAQYLRIRIPNQATTDDESFFRIGAVILFSSAIELPINPTYDYERGAPRKHLTRDYPGGGTETFNLGLYKQFQASMDIEGAQSSIEDDIWDYVNAPDPGSAFLLYENGWMGGGGEKAYLVEIKEPDIKIRTPNYNQINTNTIELIERIN